MQKIVIVIAAIVVVLGGGYWFINRDSVSESTTSNEEISNTPEITEETVTTLHTSTYKNHEKHVQAKGYL